MNPTPEELLDWVDVDFAEDILKGDYGSTTKAAAMLSSAVNYTADHVGMETRTQVFMKHIIALGVKPYLDAFKQGYQASDKLWQKKFESGQLGHLTSLLEEAGPEIAAMLVETIKEYVYAMREGDELEEKETDNETE